MKLSDDGTRSLSEHIEQIEPAITFVREILCAPESSSARALDAVRAARLYLSLYAPPAYAVYNPAALFNERLAGLADAAHAVSLEPVSDVVGVPDAVAGALEALVQSIALESDSILHIELFEEQEVPHVALSLDGPGRIPSDITLGGYIKMPLDAFAVQWTLLTRGGRLDKTPNGLVLRLKGVRLPPEPLPELEPFLKLVKDAETAFPNHASAENAIDAVIAALDELDRPYEPGDLASLMREVVAHEQNQATERGLRIEIVMTGELPPIAMRRNRITAFVKNALRIAEDAFLHGGTVHISLDYNQSSRCAQILFNMSGQNMQTNDNYRIDSMRRAIEKTHRGELTITRNPAQLIIAAALPDVIGQQLNAWIPGFDAFSDRSRQILRLLKSSGPAPPESFLLEGVLEEELGRWLLPRFSESLTINLAHEIEPGGALLPGSSPERLKKSLAQIRRGKPRKELAQPAYAAELVWAYRISQRHRAALGLERLDNAALETLCKKLLQNPPDYAAGLRLIAQAIRK